MTDFRMIAKSIWSAFPFLSKFARDNILPFFKRNKSHVEQASEDILWHRLYTRDTCFYLSRNITDARAIVSTGEVARDANNHAK